jgi:hypothetical protein
LHSSDESLSFALSHAKVCATPSSVAELVSAQTTR